MLYIIKIQIKNGNVYQHTFALRESLLYYWKNAASKYDLASFQVETYKDGQLVAIYGRRFGRV